MGSQVGYIYAVLAHGSDLAQRDRYLSWLMEGGHVRDVIDAGALAGEVAVLDDAPGPGWWIEARYCFASREAFDVYVRDRAPALRADGLKRFPADSGIRFERRSGTLLRP